MCDVLSGEPSSYVDGEKLLRYIARDPDVPSTALVYWVGVTEPSRELSFFEATQRYAPLMQLVFPDERPGVFVNRRAVHAVADCGVVKRLVFKDGTQLDVRYSGPGCDLHD